MKKNRKTVIMVPSAQTRTHTPRVRGGFRHEFDRLILQVEDYVAYLILVSAGFDAGVSTHTHTHSDTHTHTHTHTHTLTHTHTEFIHDYCSNTMALILSSHNKIHGTLLFFFSKNHVLIMTQSL